MKTINFGDWGQEGIPFDLWQDNNTFLKLSLDGPLKVDCKALTQYII